MNCHAVYSSSEGVSATEKWVNIPFTVMPGILYMRSMVSAAARAASSPWANMPVRLMPVSIFTCTFRFTPASVAYLPNSNAVRSSCTAWVISYLASISAYFSGV